MLQIFNLPKNNRNPYNLEAPSMIRLLSCFVIVLICVFQVNGLAETSGAVAALPAEADVEGENNITLDFKEADINTVLRVLSLKSKMNIVAGPEVQGNVTIRLENVPWEQALTVVLRTYGYVYERDANIIRVTTRENLAAEPLVTQTFVLNYTKAAEVQVSVQDILTERGRIKVAERTNTLIITDVPTNLYSISEVLKKLDKPTPAAFIDSKVIATTAGIAENLGIEWGTGGAGNLGSVAGSARPTTFPFQHQDEGNSPIIQQFFPSLTTTDAANAVTSRAFPNPGPAADLIPALGSSGSPTYSFGTLSFTGFSAVLQMLRTRSNTKVVSNPRIVVLNNQTASIHVGDNIPLPTFDTNSTTGRLVVSGFNYDKLKTGVTMDVTPHINANNEILVEVKPSVNALGDTISFNQDLSAPIINETTATTQVLIESGQTIAIGGLMTDNSSLNEAKVPYLSDVPVLGKLFRSKRQTAGSENQKVETLFFVTVTIVDSEGQPVVTNAGPTGTARKAPVKAPASAAKTVENASQQPAPVEGQQPAEVPVEPVTIESPAVAA